MDERTCSIDGCGKSVKSRGLCTAHYERWRKHGTPADNPKVDLPGENWAPISGYEGRYEVSDLGRVRSLCGRGRILVPWPKPKGYLMVGLRGGDEREAKTVHGLVLAAFDGPRPDDLETRHLDGDPTNNRLSNLIYGTGTENQIDRVRHGRHENAIKTHCPQGHPYDEENTRRIASKPRNRYCRACDKARSEDRKEKRRRMKAA